MGNVAGLRLGRVGLALAAGLIGGLATLLAGTAANAHAYLATSLPADGAVLDQAPEVLTLTFTERVELSATTLNIVDGDGRHWAPRSVTLREPGSAGSIAPTNSSLVEVVVGLPRLTPNVYHISWRTLSSDDLHATSGNMVLGVQRPVVAGAGPSGPTSPAPLEALLRAVGLIGMSTVLGAAGLALIIRPAPGPTRALLSIGAVGGLVALAAIPAQLLVQVGASGPIWGPLLARQAVSDRWVARELGLAALVAAVGWARVSWAGAGGARGSGAGGAWATWAGVGGGRVDSPHHRWPAVAALALGGAGALTCAIATALLGHSAGSTVLTGLVGTVHILAAGGWAGAVLVAAVYFLRLPPAATDRAEQTSALLRGFAVLAIGCVSALAVTGLLMTAGQVSTVDALLSTPYGLLLLTKVGAVLVAGLFGLDSYRRMRQPVGQLTPRHLLTEAAALTAVLGLAGALAAAGPAHGPRFDVTPSVVVVPQVSGQVADLVDTVAVRPNQPGRNVITIAISDTRRPVPAAVTGVTVLLRGPDGTQTRHPVTRTGDSWVVTVDDIHVAGSWRVSVTVFRQGMAAVTDDHPWGVGAGQPTFGTMGEFGTTGIPGPARGLALAVAGVTVLVIGRWLWRRRFVR